jgi:gas vesicle protein
MGSNDWKTRTMIVGGILGGIAGVVAAMMFIRSGEAAGATRKGRPRVQSRSALQVGIGLMGLLQKISGLAEE